MVLFVLILKNISNFDVYQVTKVFDFYWNMTDEDKIEAKKYYTQMFEEIINLSPKYDMVILDEINSVYELDLIERKTVENFISNKPENIEIIMTGRNPAEFFIQKADYISEIKSIKHPFDRGVEARKGIEY